MLIAFIHNGNAFMPEINAYTRYFEKKGINTGMIKPKELTKFGADIEWHFMGTDLTPKKKGVIKIHEYTSASVPPFSKLKNRMKKIFVVKPDYRLFLNEYVEESLSFADKVPRGFRDMGILEIENGSRTKQEKYDFIYIGNMSGHRNISRLLECFASGNMKERSILLLGKDYESISGKFQHHKNIHFKGPVPYEQVPVYLATAKFGINFIPDVAPFNQQTSTKLLEYAAVLLPIITTKYSWVRAFEKNYGGNFFYLDNKLSNFTWEAINEFQYGFPQLESFAWDRQISNSGIWEFLQDRFPELKVES